MIKNVFIVFQSINLNDLYTFVCVRTMMHHGILSIPLETSPKPHVEKSDSCEYSQTARSCSSCKQGTMPLLDSWYQPEGWRGTDTVKPQSCDQVWANNRLRSNASTKPVQISVLAWYRCPVPRQYRWTTSS